MMRTCTRVGCWNEHYARGLCYPCYRSLRRAAIRLAKKQERTQRPKAKEKTVPTRRRNPRPTPPDPLTWLDYDLLQATLDDPTTLDRAWMDSAPCTRSTINMFPDNSQGVAIAKMVCVSCDSKYSCLAYALMAAKPADDFGVYGNTSKRERNRIRKRVTVNVRPKVSDRGTWR